MAGSLVHSEAKEDGLALIYVDRYVVLTLMVGDRPCFTQVPLYRHLVFEVSSPQAFEGL